MDDDCIDFDLRTTEQRRDAGRADRRQRAIGVLAAAASTIVSPSSRGFRALRLNDRRRRPYHLVDPRRRRRRRKTE